MKGWMKKDRGWVKSEGGVGAFIGLGEAWWRSSAEDVVVVTIRGSSHLGSCGTIGSKGRTEAR